MIIVIAYTEEAGYQVKDFIEKKRRLPNYVSCQCYSDSINRTPQNANLTMSQFLYVTTALLDINTYDAKIIDVKSAPSPSGKFNPGKIQESEYRNIAANIKNFIETKRRAPNFANSSLGQLPFEALIYMYARIWAFMDDEHRPPKYVSISN